MHPVLFELGPITVYSYGFMIAVGFIVATFVAVRRARLTAVEPRHVVDLALVLLVSAILGARVFYVLQNFEFYLQNPKELLMLHRGGLVFYGGALFSVAAGILFLKKRSLPAWKTIDLFMPGIALGHAIGRIGCFLNGCCFGKPFEFGALFPGHSEPIHPVQAYESLALLFIFFILDKIQKRKLYDGQTFLAYFLLYSFTRFLLEYLRGDNSPVLLNLTLPQLVSIGIFIVAAAIWLRNTRRKKTLAALS